MKSLSKSLITLFVVGSFFTACKYDQYETLTKKNEPSVCDTSGTITYSGDIVPIMNASCGLNNNACHSTTSSSGIDLNQYSVIDAQVVSNRFLSSIIHDGNASPMPKNAPKLPECDINKIKRWINTGHLNN